MTAKTQQHEKLEDIAVDIASRPHNPERPNTGTSPSPAEGLRVGDEEKRDGGEEDVHKLDQAEHAFPLGQLIMGYLVIFVMMFIHDLSSGIFRTLNPYVTSEFSRHSLTATTRVVSSVVSAMVNLPYAKLIETWGRMQGLALMVASLLLGIVLMAVCQNVETYCAAQVFYIVGYYGIRFSILIFIADTTAIRNRAFLIGFTGSPTLATLWAYGPATEKILENVGFRWGFGLWAPIYVVAFIPVLGLLYITQKKLQRSKPAASYTPATNASVTPATRTWLQAAVHYCKIFDVVGILILTTSLSFLLLAVSIYSYQTEEWRSPLIICFLVFGGLLLPVFALYEKYLAPATFIPWSTLTSTTVIAANVMILTLQTAEQLSHAYFYSLLIVVFRQSVTNATYITNIYYVGSTVANLVIGLVLRRYGRIKYIALFGGVPLAMLGIGLMIKFRTTDSPIGFIILCQFLNAFAGGILHPIEQVLLMAVSDHEHMPALLAVQGIFAEVGKSVGYAVAGAIWTGRFEDRLVRYLPESELPNLADIYGSIVVQSSYPAGSPAFQAIAHAYGDTQRIILIVSTGILVITLTCTALWRDIDVTKLKNLRDRA